MTTFADLCQDVIAKGVKERSVFGKKRVDFLRYAKSNTKTKWALVFCSVD